MPPVPERSEIDHHTLKMIVGIIAIGMPFLVSWFASVPQSEHVNDATEVATATSDDTESDMTANSNASGCGTHNGPLDEISVAYHRHNTASDIFVGFLFAISAFLLAYNGRSFTEMAMSKVAGVASLGVALFPCSCTDYIAGTYYTEHHPYIHFGSAAVMFFILAIFCNVFRRRANAKGHPQARLRSVVYTVCGLIIIAAIVLMGIDGQTASPDKNYPGVFSTRIPRFIFYGEAIGLIAFGISWLTASRMLPVITSEQERIRLR